MAGQGITFARHHAERCNALEETAPPVDGGYLDRALWRMRLGVRIDYDDGNDMWWVSSPVLHGMGDAYSRDEAVDLYIASCESLTASNLPAETHGSGADTAGASAPASLFSSAPSVSPDSRGADAAEVPPSDNASAAAFPGAA